MNNVPRLPSLFFRQRLNAIGIPLLFAVALCLSAPDLALPILLSATAGSFLLLCFLKREQRTTLFCIQMGLILALLLMAGLGFEKNGLSRLSGESLPAEGYVIACTEEGEYDLALTRLGGKAFYRSVRVSTGESVKLGEKRSLVLRLHTPFPEKARANGIVLLADADGEGCLIGKSRLYSFVGALRSKARERLLLREGGGFFIAVLMGDKSALTDTEKQDFERTASSHILAISGLHVSLMISFFFSVFAVFPVRRRFVRLLSFPFVITLFLFAGAGISVFRASVMTLFSMSALLLRRRASSLTSLTFAAVLLVLDCPFAVESLSFLLSFSATFAVLACGVPVGEAAVRWTMEKKLPWYGKIPFSATLSLVTASSVFAVTLPVTLLLFDELQLLGPLYAVILIPLFQYALFLILVGALALPVAPFMPWLSELLFSLPSRFPDLVHLLAEAAPAPVVMKEGSLVAVAFVSLSLVLLFFRKASVTWIFLLHACTVFCFFLLSLALPFLQ